MRPWTKGDKVKLRPSLAKHAVTFGIEENEVLTIHEWRCLPGDAPSGRIRLKRATGKLTAFLEPSNFERVG